MFKNLAKTLKAGGKFVFEDYVLLEKEAGKEGEKENENATDNDEPAAKRRKIEEGEAEAKEESKEEAKEESKEEAVHKSKESMLSHLNTLVGTTYVPTQAQYEKDLIEAGLSNLEFIDMTAEWVKWTAARRDEFLENREENARLHGEEHAKKREVFYRGIADVFASGFLGGVKIVGGRK
jgi:hypothetical protein